MIIKGIIPARLKSSRFPGKPLAKICDKEMIIHVCERVASAVGKEHTIVATDSLKILSVVEKCGFIGVMTKANHLTGTDRIYEVAQKIKADIYINIQGDEPLVDPLAIEKIINEKKIYPDLIVNGMSKLSYDDDVQSNAIPKLVFDESHNLIYMSRAVIPGSKNVINSYYKQVCIYAFSYEELELFNKFGRKSMIESIEDIEILRFIDLNKKVRMVEVDSNSIAVDYPEDIEKVEKIMNLMQK